LGKKMTKTTSFKLRRNITLLVSCFLGSQAWAVEQLNISTDQMKTMGIQTAPVLSNSGDLKNRYPAQVVVPPGAEQIVTSPMQAMVSQLLVSEFQVVTKGDPVVRLTGPAMSQLQLELLQASSRASLARKAYNRENTLFEEGIIPQRRAQEAEAALREAEATLSQVRSELSLAGLSKSDTDKIIKSGSPSDGIILAAAQDGIVTSISVKPGQRVDAATALLNIAQVKVLWVDIQATSTAAQNISLGTIVNVVGKDVSGKIKSISPIIASGNQFVIMRAEIENVQGKLRPGEYISVDIPVASSGNTWDLPLSAIARNKADSVVFVKTEQGFSVRPVEVMASTGQYVRIEGDFQPRDQVAISGVIALKGAWLAEGEAE
ncbi:MAG: efflux RND transporter periplasmic adaptor subunit, partial [Pseudomonadota bacterium]